MSDREERNIKVNRLACSREYLAQRSANAVNNDPVKWPTRNESEMMKFELGRGPNNMPERDDDEK